MSWNQKEILALPESCLLERRLTKSFFLKNFPLKSAEKKILNNIIQSMQWLASIKPLTTNIPSWVTDVYAFEEIQIFTVRIANEDFSKSKHVIELIHKYIPYQIILILQSEESLIYSVCDKRINQADSSKRTIESYTHTSLINMLYKRDIEDSFLESMHFSNLTKTNLETTYQSYHKAIVQYNTARITGSYNARSHKRTEEDMSILAKIENLETEITGLKSQIKKASSFNTKTRLNIDLQNKRKTIQELQNKLKT